MSRPLRAIKRRCTRVRSFGVHTSGKKPRRAASRPWWASILSVFARSPVAALTAFGLAKTPARRAARSTGRSRARSPSPRGPLRRAPQGRGEQRQRGRLGRVRPARRTRPSSAIAASQKLRCTSSPIFRTCRSSPISNSGACGDNDDYGSVRAAHPSNRRGGQLQTCGLSARSQAPAWPTSVLPEPRPGTPSMLRSDPDGDSGNHLHAPTTTTASTTVG